ncbi:hypothetical protein N7510_009870 [Penicillium lagena]|uniref:uncharacterized protein n=1 Tax=Penicillium lagena TaxID=94218 RepID=UPI00254107E4|nr:uncharacterized protein N7510_009870 [Penicillium lagena]KAJ5604716.1 hypothetical protein N7510_009870 [Penicillium lagena]
MIEPSGTSDDREWPPAAPLLPLSYRQVHPLYAYTVTLPQILSKPNFPARKSELPASESAAVRRAGE